MYDAATGRWLSEDPIGFEGGDYNLARYVGNRATTAVDPQGLELLTQIEYPNLRTIGARIFGGLTEWLFGGNVEPYRYGGEQSTDVWQRPQGGVGGAVGGFLDEATFRQTGVLEDRMSRLSQDGAEFGASQVPFIGAANRLATGEHVTGNPASRLGAAADLGLQGAGAALGACSRAKKATDIGKRAQDIHNALDPIARNNRTTSVLRGRDGNLIVGGGARDLTPAQRALLGPDETAARLPGAHAERTVLEHAQRHGIVPDEIVTTRPFCEECRGMIEGSGGVITGPNTARWPW